MSAGLSSPFEVTGAAMVPGDDGPQTMLRIEGFTGSVAYRLDQLKAVLGSHGAVHVVTEPDTSQALWRSVRDVMPFHAEEGDIWRISARPSAAPAIVSALPAGSRSMLDWGGGLIWAAVPAGTDLRPMLPDAGHATLVRGTADVPVFHPEPAPLAALSKGLRAKFDPRGILNTGAMG
jgi:glycolate oxidase FAD binding subunit